MELPEYRKLARELLCSIFNEITPPLSDFLVLDQFFSDFEYDEKKNLEYVPNSKVIVVNRDPRDIFTYAVLKNVLWIPHDSANDFIKWYKLCTCNLDNSKTSYRVQFEDLIIHYEDIVPGLLDFLGLEDDKQIHKKKFLIPEQSIQNVGIWRNSCIDEKDFALIAKDLSEYCYSY